MFSFHVFAINYTTQNLPENGTMCIPPQKNGRICNYNTGKIGFC